MRQAPLAFALLVTAALVLAGCTAGTKDTGQTVQKNSAAPSLSDAMGMAQSMAESMTPKVAPKLGVQLSASGGSWVAPGTMLDVSVAPPAGATGALSYVWAFGPLGGTAPITTMKKTQTGYIEPGKSESITFEQAGVFYEHCHPHPWMRSNVTILDDGRAPVTATVRFVDGPNPAQFAFTPQDIVLPKGSTVVYQNDGQVAHQTMLMQQDAPLAALKDLKGSSGQVKAEGDGWMRVVVFVTDQAGHFGSAQHAVYVAPVPEPVTKKFSGSFNASVPSASPVGAPGPLQEAPQSFAIAPERAGRLFLNYSAQDGLTTNSPAGNPAGDQASIKIDIASKDGSQKVGSTKAGNKGGLEAPMSAGDHTLKVTLVDGEFVDYTITLTIVYDLVPPEPTPYADPATQISMGKM